MDLSVDLAELLCVDVVVVSGMNLCDEFIEVQGPVLRRLTERGTKIIFNGCGGFSYSSQEIAHFTAFLTEIKVSCFISRDETAFRAYKDCAAKAYNGIDCAFFLAEAFKPAQLRLDAYDVFTFDSMKAPVIQTDKRIIRAHHAGDRSVMNNILTRNENNDKTKTLRGFRSNAPLVLASDIPDDYLHIYANAAAVYSDRVHACVAALAFGKPARLYSSSPRAVLFERLGAKDILNTVVRVDQQKLAFEKEQQLSFLKGSILETA